MPFPFPNLAHASRSVSAVHYQDPLAKCERVQCLTFLTKRAGCAGFPDESSDSAELQVSLVINGDSLWGRDGRGQALSRAQVPNNRRLTE